MKKSELAAILDWVKSIILVKLYQQQRGDKRVRECLGWETPLQREREREREMLDMDTADTAFDK